MKEPPATPDFPLRRALVLALLVAGAVVLAWRAVDLTFATGSSSSSRATPGCCG
mgnify:CR=1 FL=1